MTRYALEYNTPGGWVKGCNPSGAGIRGGYELPIVVLGIDSGPLEE